MIRAYWRWRRGLSDRQALLVLMLVLLLCSLSGVPGFLVLCGLVLFLWLMHNLPYGDRQDG